MKYHLRNISAISILLLTLSIIGCVKVNDKEPEGGARLSLSSLHGLDYGGIVIGNLRSYEIQISNIGTLSASTIALEQVVAPFEVVQNSCGSSISGGETCNVTIGFRPSTVGAVSINVLISFHDGFLNQSVTANLTGRGITAPVADTISDLDPEASPSPSPEASPSPSPEASPSPSPEASPSPSPEASPSPSPEASPSPSPEASPSPSPEASPSPSPEASPSPSPEASPSPSPEASPSPSPTSIPVENVAKLSISQAPLYNYGQIYVGQTNDMAFTVTNNGLTTATGLNFSSLSPPFSIIGTTCGLTLAPTPNGTCEFTVRYSPSDTSTLVKNAVLNYHNGLSNDTASVSLQGSGKRHTLFVTKAGFNGNLGGVTGGDTKCEQAAAAAGLSGAWKALLSSSSVNAKDRVSIVTSIYNRHSDQLASNAAGLWDGGISDEVKYDQFGDSFSGTSYVWTGTKSDGKKDSDTCNNWTSSTSGNSYEGQVGQADEDDSDWISDTEKHCNQSYRLYCISQ